MQRGRVQVDKEMKQKKAHKMLVSTHHTHPCYCGSQLQCGTTCLYKLGGKTRPGFTGDYGGLGWYIVWGE